MMVQSTSMENMIVLITLLIWLAITTSYVVSFFRYTYFLNKTDLKFRKPYHSMKSTKDANRYNTNSIIGVLFFSALMITHDFMVLAAFGYPIFYILYLRIITNLNNNQVIVFNKVIEGWKTHAKHL